MQAVEDCNSQQWTGGDWEGGISTMPIINHYMKSSSIDPSIQLVFRVNDFHSRQWAEGDWGACIW
jgi:hypothetical protein